MTSNVFKYRNGIIYDANGNIPIGVQTPNGDVFSTVILAQTGIPVFLANTGSIDGAGIITLGTALAYIPANCWLWLPAAAITGGGAGLYFARFTSTTVGQVFTNFVPSGAPFLPNIPGSLANAVGAGAYACPTATDVVVASINVPGGLIGPNGSLRLYGTQGYNNSAGAKIAKASFGAIALLSQSVTTTQQADFAKVMRNRAAQNVQLAPSVAQAALGGNTTNTAIALGGEDTSGDKLFNLTVRVAVATDWIGVEGFSLEILPGA